MIKQLLLHGATLYPVFTKTESDEHCSNIGIAVYKNKLVTNMRIITYVPKLWSLFDHASENAIGYWDGTTHDVNTHRLPWNDGGYKLWKIFRGREDIRLVVWNNKLYGYGTRVDVRENKGCIELIEFDENLNIVNSVFIDNIIDVEKNWMAIPDKPFTFVWWNNPVTIIEIDPKTGHITNREEKSSSLDNVRGSTPLMKYKDKYITIVHRGSERGYEESFITYSEDFNEVHQGVWWKLNNNTITEFITGLVKDDKNVYISFTLSDIVPMIIQIPLKIFDEWYNNTLESSPNNIESVNVIARKYAYYGNYKRSLELLCVEQPLDFFTLFLWMMIYGKNKLFLESRVIDNCLTRINLYPDSADKYYLLAIIYKIIGKSNLEYIYKARSYGIPSPFFNNFFNENFI